MYSTYRFIRLCAFFIFDALFCLESKLVIFCSSHRWFGLQLTDLQFLWRKWMKKYLCNQDRCKNEQSLCSVHSAGLHVSPFSHLRFFETDKSCECVFFRLNAQCESLEAEKNHVFPAVHVDRRECFQQKEPLLFSCAGVSAKHQRLCPCRDYLHGQVALCRDCLWAFTRDFLRCLW